MEIDCAVSREDYLSGACFGRGASFAPPTATSSTFSKQFVPLKPNIASASTFKTPGASVKRGIQLHAVDLVPPIQSSSKKDATKPKNPSTYWTVVW